MDTGITITALNKQFPVNFPTVGDLLNIHSLQQQLTKGQYDKMATSNLAMPLALLDIVDAYSHFKILCPQLLSETGIKEMSDLNPVQGRDLGKIYTEQLYPWLKTMQDELFGNVKKDEPKK